MSGDSSHSSSIRLPARKLLEAARPAELAVLSNRVSASAQRGVHRFGVPSTAAHSYLPGSGRRRAEPAATATHFCEARKLLFLRTERSSLTACSDVTSLPREQTQSETFKYLKKRNDSSFNSSCFISFGSFSLLILVVSSHVPKNKTRDSLALITSYGRHSFKQTLERFLTLRIVSDEKFHLFCPILWPCRYHIFSFLHTFPY